jgi:hypothetical protein
MQTVNNNKTKQKTENKYFKEFIAFTSFPSFLLSVQTESITW